MGIKTGPGCCCDSPETDCSGFCINGTRPTQFNIEISGVVDDVCSNCSTTYNKTFVVNQSLSNPCEYFLATLGDCDSFDQVVLFLGNTAGKVEVRLLGGVFPKATFEKTFVGVQDCANFDETINNTFDLSDCDFSSATARVYA